MIDLRRKKREDLGFGSLGSGITVYDRNQRENGDFKKVAHISSYRLIQYYCSVSEEAKKKIEDFANNENPSISATQPEKVFKIEASKEPIKADIELIISEDNPLSNQVKKITGNPYSMIEFDDIYFNGAKFIKHIKTGLIFRYYGKNQLSTH
ncbi:hypothetical protein [uncultured Chryseobacterium sp.]|uniref:hypothetical protein n=1 Tax=uncultured Chryseobacterium sp. TaxID=259322 RepID=UPI0025CF3F91|nr:hypothetical protein [uncultured Chryseobacterium sp.]